MALTDKITDLHAELTQRQKAQQARALLQNARSTILETNTQIQAIADSGDFDTLDIEVKQALIAGWNVVKDADLAFSEPRDEGDETPRIISELLDWSP